MTARTFLIPCKMTNIDKRQKHSTTLSLTTTRTTCIGNRKGAYLLATLKVVEKLRGNIR